MASIGEMLRKAREAQGRSVEDLAAELCITQRYLRAIEGNDIKALPGTFFFLSFARQYAAIVGLDRDQAATMLKGIAELADKPAETSAGPHADAPLAEAGG
jgi:cytoskeleton protein RodZ